MGSLMAGWDSTVLDAKSNELNRNFSMTKEEIEAYWRSRDKSDHKEIISKANNNEVITVGDFERKFMRSSSLPHGTSSSPLGITKRGLEDVDGEISIDELIKKNGWWTRSNSAFLNEPPVVEPASNKYVSQFHVATLATSKSPGCETYY
ncbi:hypothetical protein UlMin_034232 [Ulmus minor]